MLAPDLYSSSIPPLFPLYPSFPPPQEDVPTCVWCARVGGVKWRQSPSQWTVLSQRLEDVLLSSPPLEVKTTELPFQQKALRLSVWTLGGRMVVETMDTGDDEKETTSSDKNPAPLSGEKMIKGQQLSKEFGSWR